MVTEELENAMQDLQRVAPSDFEILEKARNCWSRVEKVAGLEWAEYLDAVYEVEHAREEYNGEMMWVSVTESESYLDQINSKLEAAVLKRNETKKAFEEAANSELNTANDLFRSAEMRLVSIERSLACKREWGNIRRIIAEYGDHRFLPPRWIAETFPFFWMRMVDDWMETHLGEDHPLHASFLQQQEDRHDELDSHAVDEKRLQGQTKPPSGKKKMKKILIDKFGLECWGCGFEPPNKDERHLHLDHISPKSEGGPDGIDNRALLCNPCGNKKGSDMSLKGLRNANESEGLMKKDELIDLVEARKWTRNLLIKKAPNDEPA